MFFKPFDIPGFLLYPSIPCDISNGEKFILILSDNGIKTLFSPTSIRISIFATIYLLSYCIKI